MRTWFRISEEQDIFYLKTSFTKVNHKEHNSEKINLVAGLQPVQLFTLLICPFLDNFNIEQMAHANCTNKLTGCTIFINKKKK